MQRKVVILGGSVAGLSAAHELTERGFAVTVFEFKKIPGGKVRSIRWRIPARKGAKTCRANFMQGGFLCVLGSKKIARSPRKQGYVLFFYVFIFIRLLLGNTN